MASHSFSYEIEIVLSTSISPSLITTADGDEYVPMSDFRPTDIEIFTSMFLNQPIEIDRHIDEPSDVDHSSENSTTGTITDEFLVPFLPPIQIQYESLSHSQPNNEIHRVQTMPTESTIHDRPIKLSSCQTNNQNPLLSIHLPVPRIDKRSISSDETQQLNNRTIAGRIKRHRKSTS